jgi:hypothetical protein
MFAVPFRVFGVVARFATSPRRGVLSELAARSEFRAWRSTACIWFSGPALPLAVSSAVRFSFAGLPRPNLIARRALSSGFAFLQSLAQRHLVRRPQPANSSHGLSVPTALEDSAIHLTRAVPARYVPSSGFGYPLDGFLPPDPCRFSLAPAALLGFTLRSLPLSQGAQRVSAWADPRAVFPVVSPAPPKRTRPARQAAASGL